MNKMILTLFLMPLTMTKYTFAASRCENIFKIHDLTTYQLVDEKPIGLQIFERDLLAAMSLIERIQRLPKEVFLQEVMKRDLRKHFFRLQSISSIYAEKAKHEKFFTDLKTYTKEFEDLLGQIDLQKSLKERADKFNLPELSTFFAEKQVKAQELAYQRLSEEQLLIKPKKTLKQLYSQISEVKSWNNVVKDKSFLVNVIAEKAEKLQKSCEEMKFDQADIELGLHELRRHLRWSVIQLALIDGAIVNTQERQLPEKLNHWLTEMQTSQPQLLTSKFIQRMLPQISEPIQAPHGMTAMISQIVTDIGTAKDLAEMQLYFNQAAQMLGWSQSKIDNMNQQISSGSVVDHQELARRYQMRIADTGLMHEFARWMKEYNK